jgi:hypothetical protein
VTSQNCEENQTFHFVGKNFNFPLIFTLSLEICWGIFSSAVLGKFSEMFRPSTERTITWYRKLKERFLFSI